MYRIYLLKIFIFIVFIYVYVFVCVSECRVCTDAHGGQKRTSNTL